MSYEPRFKIMVSQEGYNHGLNCGLEIAGNIGVMGTNGVDVVMTRAKAGEDIGGGKIAYPHEGNWCAYLSTTGNTKGMYWFLSPLTSISHTVSVYVKPVNPNVAIPPFVFAVGTNGTVSASKTAQLAEITGDGWMRYTATFTAAETNGVNMCWILTPSNNGGATFEVWVDSFQFERGTQLTTFMRGSMGDGYSFKGVPNASTTHRRARYLGKRVKGGVLVPLDNGTTIRCEAALGIGIMPVTPITQERAAAPGTMYQSTTIKERAISLRLLFVAGDVTELHYLMAGVVPLFNVEDGEFTLQYTLQGITQEIDVVYSGGMEFGDLIGAGSQRVVVQLTAPNPFFREVGHVVRPLSIPTTTLTADHINIREAGVWKALGTSVGLLSKVYVTPDQTLYVSTINNGDGFAYLRFWNETAWSTLGKVWGNNTRINGIKLSPSGTRVYIWGSFGFAAKNDGTGQITANNIAYYDLTTGAWGTLSPGLNGEVHDLDFDKANTYIYITGAFTATSNSSVTLNGATRWEIAASAFRALTSGLGGTGYAVKVMQDGNVAFGGSFQAAGALTSPVTGISVSNLGTGSWTNIGRSYRVAAFDKQGRETAQSASVAAPSNTAGSRITWNPVLGAAYYEIYWYPSGGTQSGLLATGITGTQYDHTTATTINAGYAPPPQNLAIGTGPGWRRTSPYLRTQWNGEETTGTPNIALYKPDKDDWYTLGRKGFNGAVRVLLNSKDGINLHAFGDFTIGEGDRVFNHAAYLLGTSFRAMGKGLGSAGTVYDAVLASDGSIWVAGSFLQAGGRPVGAYLAQWRGLGELGTWIPSDFPAAGAINSVALLYNEPLVGYNGWSTTIAAPLATTFTYRGTAYEYPVIMATGPCRLIAIENHTTNSRLYFDLVLADGELLTLDLRTGFKTMRSSAFDNLIDRILPGSDTGSFRIAPGTNVITVYMTGYTSNTAISLYLRNTHLSADGGL